MFNYQGVLVSVFHSIFAIFACVGFGSILVEFFRHLCSAETDAFTHQLKGKPWIRLSGSPKFDENRNSSNLGYPHWRQSPMKIHENPWTPGPLNHLQKTCGCFFEIQIWDQVSSQKPPNGDASTKCGWQGHSLTKPSTLTMSSKIMRSKNLPLSCWQMELQLS